METTIGFRGEGIDRVKNQLKDVSQTQIDSAKESLQITIEEQRVRSTGDADYLKRLEKQLQIKKSQVEITRLKDERSSKDVLEKNLQSLGPDATDLDKFGMKYSHDMDVGSIRSDSQTQKKTLDVQLAILAQLKEQGKQLSQTPEGRAQAQALSLNDSESFDSVTGAAGRLAGSGSGGSGGIGKMLSGVMGKFGAVLGAGALASAAWGYAKQDRQAIASAQTGEGYLISKEKNLWNTLSFGLGAGDWITSGKERSLQARSDWTREASGIYGLTGVAAQRMGWGNKFGMTSTQLASDSRQLSEAMLDPTADLESVIATRKGFGLQGGQAMGLASMGLASSSSYLDTMGVLRSGLGLGSIDKVRSGGLLAAVNATSQAQMQLGGTDTAQNMQMAMALNSAGGSFGDARLTQRMSTMNNALTNPNNDFQKMNTYRLLRGIEGLEGASWTELEMAREKGLGQEGFLQAVIKDAITRGGGKDGAVENIKNRLGLSTTDANTLHEKFKSNPELFENLEQYGDDKAIKDFLLDEGKKGTSNLEVQKAVIDEAFITSATAGMDAVTKIKEMLEIEIAKAGNYVPKEGESVTKDKDGVVDSVTDKNGNTWLMTGRQG